MGFDVLICETNSFSLFLLGLITVEWTQDLPWAFSPQAYEVQTAVNARVLQNPNGCKMNAGTAIATATIHILVESTADALTKAEC